MATSADQGRRVEVGLGAIEAVLHDLPTVVSAWSSMGEDERIVWSIEWGNEMSRLHRLVEDEAAGRLSSEQAGRCRALVERVREAQASIDALGLRGLPPMVDSPSPNTLRRAVG